MKSKLIFRVVAVAVTLSLLMLTLPLSPALAATYSVNVENYDEESEYYEEPIGTIGDTIRVWGDGIPARWIDVYFSSQEADVRDDLDVEVTAYEWLIRVHVHGTLEDFDASLLAVPGQLTDGDDAEDVHDGLYYIYIAEEGDTDIKAMTTFTVVGIAEVALDIVEGTVGTEVEISGQGFAVDEVIAIEYDGDALDIESGSATTDSNGEFILTIIVPESAFGVHTIVISGTQSLAELEATFTVEPEITIDPEEGQAGTFVTIIGTGFDGNGDVVIYFGDDVVKTKRAGGDGSIDTFFIVPDVVHGNYGVVAEDEDDDAISAETVFAVTITADPEITISPTSGIAGDTVTVNGSGFIASLSVTIYFDDVSVSTSATDTNGDFTGTLTVPAGSQGSHAIKAEDADDNFATATFTITANPEITVSPTSGLSGDTVTVSGSGFVASSSITIYFDGASVGTSATNTNGDFTGTLTVPAGSQGGHIIKAQDSAANFATATFTVGEKITVAPVSGFVGDTVTVSGSGFAASSSVSITFDDAGVGTSATDANGSFTATFTVPSSAGGSHIIEVQDATATFTVGEKITVAPASGLSGDTVTVSGSGFIASSSVSITFDDASVGTSATDANGSFTATFTVPSSASGSHTIKAHDATATFTVGESITVAPISGLVGDTVTVSGSGFAASSSVSIYFDNTSVGTATTTSSGTFSGATFTVPSSASGSHTIKAQDATATFTVGESITVAPISGLSGDAVTVSGSGFGGNKSIDIYLDNILIAGGTATTGVDGDFTAAITIPARAGGSHVIKAQDSIGNSATATLTVEHEMAISPATGASGTTVSVNGTGFGAIKTITVRYNNVPVSTSPAIILTDVSGGFSGSFSLPASPAGNYTVEVSDGTYSYSANFVAVASAAISKTTSASSPGNVGMELTISGDGFKANTTVTVTYETDPVVLDTAVTDSQGSFSVAVTIPASVGGAHTITATDGETTRQFAFVMEQQAPPPPQLLLPVVGDKPKQPVTLDWADVTDDSLPLTYTLQIASDQNFTTLVLEKTGLSVSEYTLSADEKLESVSKNAPYYWRVQATDGASNASLWTADGSFQIGFVWPMPDWVKYLLIGLGVLAVIVVGFWLGMRTAYSSF